MKKQVLILALAILLAGCVGPQMAPPMNGQTYGGGYNALPPSNSYATPWVGANTPWVYYQNDWFLNGVLYHNYGNQYGWAPYYSYPPTYIVRPNNWYGPRWHTWYQQNPQYHQNFTQKYPYWRGHHSGQRYDQNFYNQHHQGQGGGWHKGFHGGQTPGTYGPAGRGPGATGPGGHTPGTTGPVVHTPGGPGPAGRGPVGTGPAVRTPGTTGPAVRTPGTTGPAVRTPGTTGPTVRTPGGTGPAVRTPGAAGPAQSAPGTTGSGRQKPAKTPPADKKQQQQQ
jgi:hypothetical protein